MPKIIITIDGKNAEVEVEGEARLIDLMRASIEVEEKVKNTINSSTVKKEEMSEALDVLLEMREHGKVGETKDRNTEDGDASRPPVYPSFFKGHEFSKTEGR